MPVCSISVLAEFLEPIARIARRHPELQRLRLVVDNPGGQDQTLHCETASAGEALGQAVAASIREVVFCEPSALPNDAK
ncbi:MAG: hypothetical protein WAW42_20885 [Candidatus Competibacteraceae bacterium]|jgi:phenylacetate-CoA ligase